MHVKINTDHNIEGHEALAAQVSGVVEIALSRLSDRITRVEVYLTAAHSTKKEGIDDIRCVLEARLEGLRPVVATHQAVSVEQAVEGAADKLIRLIDSTLGKLRDRAGGHD